MPDDRLPDEVQAILERKRAWHRARAAAPLREKVRVLLELQRQDLPLNRPPAPAPALGTAVERDAVGAQPPGRDSG